MTTLRGARALITGASSGIGRATALALAERGCNPILVARDAERLAAVAGATAGVGRPADLTDPDDLAALADEVATDPPAILVHNAGVGLSGPASESEPADARMLFDLNVFAPMVLTRAALPGMLARGSGHLVFVTSIAGQLGVAGEAAYSASKAALQVYADSVRGEVATRGVVVTTVVPGVVRTEFFDRRGVPYRRRSPRPISAERVAAATVSAIERNRAHVVVPAWLRVPVALRGALPGTFSRLASRFG